jgi:hypothetical protein
VCWLLRRGKSARCNLPATRVQVREHEGSVGRLRDSLRLLLNAMCWRDFRAAIRIMPLPSRDWRWQSCRSARRPTQSDCEAAVDVERQAEVVGDFHFLLDVRAVFSEDTRNRRANAVVSVRDVVALPLSAASCSWRVPAV